MTLSVLTLNLWHDAGPWEKRRELVQAWIDRLEPDLIGLQEVLRGPDVDQAAELLAGRGYHLDFAAARCGWRGELDFGNAVGSRWPIVAREAAALPDSGDGEQRCALSVAIAAPFGELGFTCTHLNWKFHHGWIRERQMVAVCDLALRLRPKSGFPPILVGDMNAEPDSAEVRYATGLQSRDGRSVAFLDAWGRVGDGGPGSTWSSRNRYAARMHEPERRIDYVLVGHPGRRGVGQLLSCRVVCDEDEGGIWPSDHFGVYAELRSEADER